MNVHHYSTETMIILKKVTVNSKYKHVDFQNSTGNSDLLTVSLSLLQPTEHTIGNYHVKIFNKKALPLQGVNYLSQLNIHSWKA